MRIQKMQVKCAVGKTSADKLDEIAATQRK